MSYWYFDGGDGRRFCYAKDPTFTCPIGSAERIGDLFEAVCEEVGIDPAWLLRRMRHSAGRKRVNDKLTDRCEHCGHRLKRLGFRCWVEVEKTGAELEETGAQLTQLIGGTPTRTIKSFYLDTKRQAVAWAREEANLAKHVKESDR